MTGLPDATIARLIKTLTDYFPRGVKTSDGTLREETLKTWRQDLQEYSAQIVFQVLTDIRRDAENDFLPSLKKVRDKCEDMAHAANAWAERQRVAEAYSPAGCVSAEEFAGPNYDAWWAERIALPDIGSWYSETRRRLAHGQLPAVGADMATRTTRQDPTGRTEPPQGCVRTPPCDSLVKGWAPKPLMGNFEGSTKSDRGSPPERDDSLREPGEDLEEW